MAGYHTSPRLFVPDDLKSSEDISLNADQSHYLLHVLRLKLGEPVRLFNGKHGEWLSKIEGIAKHSVKLALHEQLRQQMPEPDLWLCCAPIKKAHFDFVIGKATELGVAAIQPILTNRTQVREINQDRCRAIAIEAAEQSERLSVPKVFSAITLNNLLKEKEKTRKLIVCAEFGESFPISQALQKLPPSKPASIITGPEGGFTVEEMKSLCSLENSVPVRLGPRILRADTAALAALACWQACCGDWQ